MAFKLPATLLCDFYKIGHKDQYPKKTTKVYSTWIPRTSRLHFADKVVAFGFQGFIKEYLIDFFNENFFQRPVEEVIMEYARVIKFALGVPEPDVQHIRDLHALGYLPLRVKALPEGTLCPIRVPMLTIENTDPRFGWLTNYIETLASCSLWQSATSATIALAYKKILTQYSNETSDMPEFVQFQGHDFSMRGMGSLQSACTSGAGHMTSFVGTDTIPAILYLEYFYNCNIERELIGCSVNATEHSVMCAGGADDEYETYKRLITGVYPTGIVSIVSDTWDLWNTITHIMADLKPQVMERDGKVVIRPDSGDPVYILCGYRDEELIREDGEIFVRGAYTPHKDRWGYEVGGTYAKGRKISEAEAKGVVQLLYEIYGGTKNSKGYIQLDPHIGTIYGDAITVDRCKDILLRLKEKGYASTNIVLGIGSFTYQYNTRDTFGFAMKATWCEIDGKEVNIFKDPVTDADKIKKSLTGKCAVVADFFGETIVVDGLSAEQEATYADNALKTIFEDGKLLVEVSLAEIRQRLNDTL